MTSVRLYDLNGTGGTFDESSYLRIAVLTHEAIKNLDFSKETWTLYSEHPPVGKYILSLFYSRFTNSLTPQEKQIMIAGFYPQPNISGDIYTPGRYASVLYGGLTVVLIYIFCAVFLTRRTGIIACLLLAFLPTFIPYFKVASLDAPTAFFYTLGVLMFAFAMKYDTWKWWIWLGIITGLGIATKFNMGMLLIFYVIMFLVWKGPHILKSTKKQIEEKNVSSAAHFFLKEIWYWKLFLVPIIAFIVVYILWPWLWSDPLGRLQESTSGWHNPARSGRVYPWFGSMEPAQLLAYPVYYLFTTPAVILVLFLFSCYFAIRRRGFWSWFLLLWFVLPSIIWTRQYDIVGPNIRYMIMTWPPMAILCAQGLQNIFKKQRHLISATLVVLVYLILIDIWIHPYYVDYYNELIGGPGAVQKGNLLNFNAFAEGKKEATEWINQNALAGASIGIKWDPQHDFGGFRQDIQVFDLLRINYTGTPLYILTNHRYNQYIKERDIIVENLSKYNLVYAVKAGNGELGWIYELKH